jgi:hypothetical protein
MLKVLWLVASFYFGHDNLEGTDRLKPPGWKGNAWGPEATEARATGKIPPITLTPSMKQWQAWGKKVLRGGDLVFRRGDAKILRGHFPMSRFIANVSGSVFSHTGVVSIEDGEPVVYDTTSLGVRRQPFYIWMLDSVGEFGVKRVRPEYAAYAPKAVAFVREQFVKQPPFDYDLGLDNTAYYCVEMTEKAYRNNGLPLAPPVRLGDMENVARFPICVYGFLKFTNLTLDMEVYFPGNERHGIWSSPFLMTVYAPPGGVTAKIKSKWRDTSGASSSTDAQPRHELDRTGQKTAAGAGNPTSVR